MEEKRKHQSGSPSDSLRPVLRQLQSDGAIGLHHALLQLAQAYGSITIAQLRQIADLLRLAPAEVYGVATYLGLSVVGASANPIPPSALATPAKVRPMATNTSPISASVRPMIAGSAAAKSATAKTAEKKSQTIKICMGKACQRKGAAAILAELEQLLASQPANLVHKVNLKTCDCLGECGKAPVLNANGQLLVRVRAEELAAILSQMTQPRRRPE